MTSPEQKKHCEKCYVKCVRSSCGRIDNTPCGKDTGCRCECHYNDFSGCSNPSCPCHTPTLSSLIEEQGRKFDEFVKSKWVAIPGDIDMRGVQQKHCDLRIDDIKSFLASSNRAVIERVVEMIEGMKVPVGNYQKTDSPPAYNQALSDLRDRITKSK